MKLLNIFCVLVLAGCATAPSGISPQIINEFSSKGVSGAVVDKVSEGRPLSVAQVAEAASKGVPGPGLVSYMQSTRKAYRLTGSDVATLKAAGTPAPVITYMKRSAGYYTHGPQAVPQNHPYFSEDRNVIEAPFAYAPPQVDTFFNSGYEESLYSPFSMN